MEIIREFTENKTNAGAVTFKNKVFLISGSTASNIYSNKVYAADLPAPAMNLFFKEGNATAEAELSTLGMADGSVTLGQLDPDALAKIGLDHNPATAEGSLLAVPRNDQPPPGYALYKRSDRNGSLVWEERASLNTPRGARTKTVVSLDGKIYFVGYQTDIVERYDPLRNEWQQVASLNEARTGHACAALNGKIYAIGGQDSATVEIYDPTSDSWSYISPLPER